jgi:UDP-N-acetylmuramoylalanine--D-glutamate ligase
MKIAIAGYGVEGEQSYRYFKDRGHDITIVDENLSPSCRLPDDSETLLGESVFSQLMGYDLVVRTAGLSPHKIKTDGTIWSATNEFFDKCPAHVIGVTGTKGKGTTSSFIYEILKAAGRDVYLVGNIGVPALEILSKLTADSIVVYELSSFQLWDIYKSPQVAVVLPIEADHLDVHLSLDEYVTAKSNIVRYQSETDVVIFNAHNSIAVDIAQLSSGKKVKYPFPINGFESVITLPGVHNIENASAAIAACRVFDVDDDAIYRGIAAFTGLPHRLQFVATVGKVSFYDDSISTTPGSAIAALRSFEGRSRVIILGGHDKGVEYDQLLRLCHDEQATVIAIGENREKIANLCVKYDVKYTVEPGKMQDIVNRASIEAKVNDSVVILSPAASSFDMFKNYSDRGDQFIAAVHRLASI